ncbi:hypothetical protein A2617_04910 [Candidatus Daviesbacteria bacterium RIFOXYD1_FULL_41_10]|uniref:Uncharacterized protein n=2 Tax=Candidatus Daviesiibacteriota TaxID=1752718 RepID=A0A1F5N346_9BACT|nr:MAG: hypothetical protein UU67_C0011G0002 [Candidatus Daviesbacteria bacterium GW2011_GWB1_41_5]OGE71982.1 MAG: hypothetical protein A2617_04910 [Candidatus Daviesbacteria bacterium RIFOXYD1_FULL_41_10]
MNYLERNELILKEVGEQLENGIFRRGRVIGKSGSSKFTSIGTYNSPTIGANVHVGIKESLSHIDLDIRAEMEMTRIAVISKHSSFLTDFLPQFHGYLLGGNNKTMIITEDFLKEDVIRWSSGHTNGLKCPIWLIYQK